MDWPPQSQTKTKTQHTDTAGMMHSYIFRASADQIMAEGVPMGPR